MLEVRIYKKKNIEKIIKDYNLPKKNFEICGSFLGNYYVIIDNEYLHSDNSPCCQLKRHLAKYNSTNSTAEVELIKTSYSNLVTEITDEVFKDKEELIEEIDSEIVDLEKQIESLKNKKQELEDRK